MTLSNSNILDLSDGEQMRQMGVTTGLHEVPLTSTKHVYGCEDYYMEFEKRILNEIKQTVRGERKRGEDSVYKNICDVCCV